MLIDLLSTSNYAMYNVKVAEILGLHSAIYLSELININDKAEKKSKIEDGYFTIDRNYIKKRTTLDKKEQKEIEKILKELHIIYCKDEKEDCIKLDIQVLTSILMNKEESLVKDISDIAKKKERKTKNEAIIDNLKSYVITDNSELRDAYNDWIESVYAKQGWMSKKSVVVAQKTVDEFCNHNLDLALKLLDIASIGGYRDIEWAINNYKKDCSDNYNKRINDYNLNFNNQECKTDRTLSDQIF